MRHHSPLALAGLCLALAPSAFADAPLHVSVTKPLTPVADVLADLAKQSGATILTDSTVVAPVGVADLKAQNVGEMLTGLKALDPGLTWHKVYLPAGAPLPTGDALSAQVRALQAVATDGLTVTDAASSVSFARTKTAAAPPAGTQAVYLVTDEDVRAQRAAAKTKAAAPEADTPTAQVATGMKSVADNFAQMTPDQQRQALPQMFQQFQSIMQSIDPAVRDDLRQQMRQQRRNRNNPPGPAQ